MPSAAAQSFLNDPLLPFPPPKVAVHRRGIIIIIQTIINLQRVDNILEKNATTTTTIITLSNSPGNNFYDDATATAVHCYQLITNSDVCASVCVCLQKYDFWGVGDR